jgi:hypothetical protein
MSQKGFNTGPRQVTTAIFFFETYLMKEGVAVMVEWPTNPYIKTIRTKIQPLERRDRAIHIAFLSILSIIPTTTQY